MKYVVEVTIDDTKKLNIVIPNRLLALIRAKRPIGINLSFAMVNEEEEHDASEVRDILEELLRSLDYLHQVRVKLHEGELNTTDVQDIIKKMITSVNSTSEIIDVLAGDGDA